MKAFVALFPPIPIRDCISRYPHVTQPQNKMHITVHFIGTVTQKQIDPLKELLREVSFPSFLCKFQDAGAFNNTDGSLHLKAHPHKEFKMLHEKVAAALSAKPFKKYTPHLTVATYVQSAVPKEHVEALSESSAKHDLWFRAERIHLVTSHKGVYRLEDTVWLRKGK